ncbi:MAG: DPP IV N-terminal domain-containing protein [Planctomycetota bacterium]|nr:DPP IV N-terminal domain-containing protein [Planctomycetota bacterium]
MTATATDSATISARNTAFLEQYALTYRFQLGQPKSITLTPTGDAVLFLRSGPRTFVQDLYELDTRTGQERVLLTAEQVLSGGQEKLTAEELARRERMRMTSRGIASFQLSKDGNKILVPLSGRLFVITRADGKITELKSEHGYPIDPQFSPDATKVACVRDGDLYVFDIASGEEDRLTRGATATLTNGLAEFVAQEELDRLHGYWWSPNSNAIVYQQTDTSNVEIWRIADPVSPEKEAAEWRYPRPGKNNAALSLGVAPINSNGKTFRLPWDHDELPYIADVQWDKDGPLTISLLNRLQTKLEVFTASPPSPALVPLVRESDEAWVNLSGNGPRWLKDGRFLWLSEQPGAWTLQLRTKSGDVMALTPPDFGLRSLVDVDEAAGVAYVIASGDPTQAHLWRVPLTGGTPTQMTSGRGLFGAAFSDDHKVYVESASTVDGRATWTVKSIEGKRLAEVRSVAEEPSLDPKVEWTTVRGEREYHAAIIRPTDFKAGVKYPVLVAVYGGPHSAVVMASRRAYLLHQWYADHGFVVVTLDGRGTPNRGRAWERAIKNNLIDIPLNDQVDGLKALGAKYAELDLSRVGIYGWSFGGYFSAMAAMRRPDIYDAGVAGAPVCDWRDYDTAYTERYMDLPETNPSGYDASSVLTYCDKLEKPLLIIHGTADDNVYFLHSLKMTQNLFRAGKNFEFLPLAGFTHMVPDPVVTTRLYSRIADFMVRNVKNKPSESKLGQAKQGTTK